MMSPGWRRLTAIGILAAATAACCARAPGADVDETARGPQSGPAAAAGDGARPDAENAPTLQDRLDELPFTLSGFLDSRAGTRTVRDPHERTASLAELRLQLDAEKTFADGSVLKVKPDFLYDPVPTRRSLDLEEGRGWLDLREANYSFTPAEFIDVKLGRQILTWGTGDLLFLNDMFPKDWNSFFSGRDVEYLKAPSDAIKVSGFTDWANLDVVYTPRFDADRYVDGDRMSYFNPRSGRRAGRDAFVRADRPDDWFSDSEIAWRLSRNARGYELALYGYYGFWKSPAGFDRTTGRATFPDLSTWGWSARGPLGKGIVNVEMAYYDSRDDRDGDDPLTPNSQMRGLLGYTQEIARDLTLGVQYYLEHMMGSGAYGRALPAGMAAADENRHVLTLRLTRLAANQNLKLSLFAFYSPNDNDAYLRPNAGYRLSDHWSAEVGANFFFGNERHTFFNQFASNSNVYAALRYSF